MNFRKINFIINIYTFFLNKDNKYILIDKKDNLIFNDKILPACGVLTISNGVFGFSSNFKNSIFNLQTSEIQSFKTTNSIDFVIDENRVIESYESTEKPHYHERLIDLHLKKVLFDFHDYTIMRICYKDLFITIGAKYRKQNKHIITCFSLTKINYLWHYNLDSLYESHVSQMAIYDWQNLPDFALRQLAQGTPKLQIYNLIGVHNGLLWVDVDVFYKGSFLLALNAETGAVVHLLQNTQLQTSMPTELYHFKSLPRYAKSYLDIESNQIIGFSADFDHWQVDLSQPEPILKFWYLEENFKNIPEAHAVQIDFSGITPTHIFFPNSHGHFPQVIAFNRKTMQVDWRQVFNDEKGYFSPKQVKANDTHLFVHMSDNSLHIFEKTED